MNARGKRRPRLGSSAQNKLARVNFRRKQKGRKVLPVGFYENSSMYPIERMVAAPVAVNPVISHSSTRANRIVISHSELIQQVFGAAAYGTQTYAINPGNASTFPWLAQVADIWDMYEYEALTFRYEPATATSTTGAVFMGFDYDVLDPPPISKGAFMMMGESVSAPPWTQCSISLPPSKLHARGPLFCSGSGVPASADKKTYHLGNLFIGTQGQTGSAYLGDLFADYRIVFTMPQQNRSPVCSAITNTANMTSGHPFGTVYNNFTVATNPDLCSSPPGTMYFDGTNSRYGFTRSGTYIVVFEVQGTSLTQSGNDLTLYLNTGFWNTDYVLSYSYVTSGTYSCYAAFVQATEGNSLKVTINSGSSLVVANFLVAIIDPASTTL